MDGGHGLERRGRGRRRRRVTNGEFKTNVLYNGCFLYVPLYYRTCCNGLPSTSCGLAAPGYTAHPTQSLRSGRMGRLLDVMWVGSAIVALEIAAVRRQCSDEQVMLSDG